VNNLYLRCFSIGFIILLLDQASKVCIKTSFEPGESVVVFPWFFLHFVENNGFAFGYEFFGDFGKVFLTLFRVFFAFFVFRWLIFSIKKVGFTCGTISLLLIFSGATGNIIDSVFYGVFFNYAPLLFGRVVDMFYFPLFESTYPDWIPLIGGDSFVFFGYIFNVADSAITIGAILLFFAHKELSFNQ